jgi:hypothetical protein
MPVTTVGYQRLIDQWKLSALPLSQVARIDTRVKGRETQADGTGTQLLFEPRYQPEASFEGDLQFALRYEAGVALRTVRPPTADCLAARTARMTIQVAYRGVQSVGDFRHLAFDQIS